MQNNNPTAKETLDHRMQHLMACLIQNGWGGLEIKLNPLSLDPLKNLCKIISWFDHSFYDNLKNLKWPTGSGKWGSPSFLGAPVNFCKTSFMIRALRKGCDGGEKTRGKRGRGTFLVATNVVASRPPKHRPTGMPTAHAKIRISHIANEWNQN